MVSLRQSGSPSSSKGKCLKVTSCGAHPAALEHGHLSPGTEQSADGSTAYWAWEDPFPGLHAFIWLVVSTPPKNISQLGVLFSKYGKITFMFWLDSQDCIRDAWRIDQRIPSPQYKKHPRNHGWVGFTQGLLNIRGMGLSVPHMFYKWLQVYAYILTAHAHKHLFLNHLESIYLSAALHTWYISGMSFGHAAVWNRNLWRQMVKPNSHAWSEV